MRIHHPIPFQRAGWLAVLLLAAGLGPGAASSETPAEGEKRFIKKAFPRLAGVHIGRSPYDGYSDPEYQALIAKQDLAILGGMTKGVTRAARGIKRRNPNILLARYTNLANVAIRRKSDYHQGLRKKLSSERGPNDTNAHDWWLRTADGENVEIFPGNWRINITEYVQPDSKGRRWPEFRAEYDYERLFKDPVWDLWSLDHSPWKPKFRNRGLIGDFSGGEVTDHFEIYAAWRRGHRSFWEAIRRLTPDKMILVNHNWYLYQDKFDRWDLHEYDRQVEGGFLERVMGPKKSLEYQRGWKKLHDYYTWSMSYFIEPRLVVFNVKEDPENYQFFRYAFGTCLLNDGYFHFSQLEYHYGSVEWFDEYDLAGNADTSWMGEAVSEPPATPWRSGVWRRDFEHAVVLVNPRDNGPQTLELEPGLRRISGEQDPVTNDGSQVSTVSLAAADGLILMRESVSVSGQSREAGSE